MFTSKATHFVARETSAFSFRSFHLRPKARKLGEIYGVTNGIFRRRKMSGGYFSLNPMCSIRGQFDFHDKALSNFVTDSISQLSGDNTYRVVTT
jgi:hypothetical protein